MKPKLWSLLLCLCCSIAYGQSFFWNSSFGNGGLLQKSAAQPGNADYEVGESSVQLADGKVLAAVSRSNFYLFRYNANGTLDSSYGNAGRSTRYYWNSPKLYKLADGRVLMVGTDFSNGIAVAIQRLQADGNIDPSFNNGMLLRVPYPTTMAGSIFFNQLPDGKIMLVATTQPGYTTNIRPTLIRLLSTGMPDPTFGNTSKELTGFPIGVNTQGMSISGNRMIGSYIHPQTGRIMLVAHNFNGDLDITFGNLGNGTVDLGVQPYQQTVTLSALPDGRILVGITNIPSTSFQLWHEIRCLLPDGTPDAGFGANGAAMVPQSPNTNRGVMLVPDANGFTSVSYSSISTTHKVSFTRFTNNGHLETSYGLNGQQHLQFSGDYTELKEATTNETGKITLVGRVSTYPTDYFFLTRLHANGQPDNTWSAGGTKFDYIPSKRVEIDNIRPYSNGSLLARYNGMGLIRESGIIKLTPTGNTDSTFANKGLLAFNYAHFDTLSSGGLITAEPNNLPGEPNQQLKLTRYLPNGKLDYSFGNAGVLMVTMPLNFQLMVFRVLPGNKVLVYGSFINYLNSYRYVAIRLLADGSIDTSFADKGLAYFENNMFTTREIVSLTDGSLLFSGDYNSYNGMSKFGLAKLLANGQRDASFGNNGFVTDSSGQSSFAQKILPQPGGNFIYVYYGLVADGPYTYYKRILARYNANGQRVNNFGNTPNGILEYNALTYSVIPDGRLLAFKYDFMDGKPAFKLELRTTNGIIDSTYGTNGVDYLPMLANNANWSETVNVGSRIFIKGSTYEEFETKALIGAIQVDSTSAAIASFTLVDATSNKDIRTIKEGDIINIAEVRGKSVNIRANTNDAPVGSVVMTLGGAQQKTQTESSAPYALFGNTNNDYWNWTPVTGQYSLYARPYKGTKGTGAPGKALNVSFRVKDELTLAGLSLINADNNRVIRPLVNNAVIDLAYTPNINVRANAGVGYTESVLFMVNGFYHRVENVAPFAIAADNNGDYNNWNITPGAYNIAAIPYPENDAKGLAGTPYNIWINVINSAPVAGSSMQPSGNAPALKNEGGFTVGVYPNPMSGEGTLTYGAVKTSYLSVTLFDATGAKVQQVFSGKVEGGVLYRTALNIRHLKAGTYFCRILTADGGMQTVQVVKQ